MTNKMTIDDIARALGISKTTVSRAISGKGRVGGDTRARVMDYIKEHNYRPNMTARGLAQQKTFNIGVVWPDDYNAVDLPFFQRCMIGMSEMTSVYGYDILVTLVNGGDFSGLKRIIANHKVDGIILTRALVDDKQARYLRESRIPFVTLGSGKEDDIIYIDNDNLSACRELTAILIAKGLKRLALIGGSMDHNITRTRRDGFMEAYKDAGITPDADLIYLGVENKAMVRNILKDLVKKDIDGIVCMDDNLAGEVLARCRDQHIRIPDDIKLASFYNSSLLEGAVPSVTSLNFDDRNLGAVAARSLLEMIDGEKVKSRVLRGYEVILKESTK